MDEDKELGDGDRLKLTGSEVERILLRSAGFDRPLKGALGRLSDSIAKDDMRSPFHLVVSGQGLRPRPTWLGLCTLSAAAAGIAFWASRAPMPKPAADRSYDPVVVPKLESPPLVDPALANCANPIVATGAYPLIDDFEDRNARILPNEGRSGAWMVYNDGTGTQTPTHGNVWHPVSIPGGRGASRYALHTWGGIFGSWGVTGGFRLATPSCYDASVYDGVKFWAKGPGKILFTAKMTQVVAVEDGGTCRDKCYDVHRKAIDLSKRWAEYTVKWNELFQQGHGQPVPFDARSLHALEFFVYGEDTPFDFWIDDVSFLPGT